MQIQPQRTPQLLVLLLVLLLPLPLQAAESRKIDDFEAGLSPRWEIKEFHGLTEYTVVTEGRGKVLHARSRGTAAGLVYQEEYDLRQWPLLAWRWKIAATIAGGDESRKSGDDYAARIYVVFPHWFFPKTRSINYIWSNRLPRGESIANPYSARVMMVAVESGPAHAGEWIVERRNVLADYRRLFGEEPPAVGAIAIMTDSDNTGTSAEAWYDDIRLEKE